MKSDIITEGFNLSEKIHGLRYTKVIADRDSKVYFDLKNNVSYGRHVEKVHCANHLCKNLRSNLEQLVINKPHYKGRNGLTKHRMIRIALGVRAAIRMRSKDQNRAAGKMKLKQDIHNVIHHVFGHHKHCSPDFCKKTTRTRQPDPSEDHEDDETCEDVLEEQVRYWKEVNDSTLLEECRLADSKAVHIPKDLAHDVSRVLSKLSEKVGTLIDNANTNLAELWMSMRARFDGHKFTYRCNAGSWNHRCNGAALRFNPGPEWSPSVWRIITREERSIPFKQVYQHRQNRLDDQKKYRSNSSTQSRRRKRALQRNIEAT